MTSIRSLLSLALVSSTLAANFNYPYASSIQSFSETLQPGACIGVFQGAHTNFTCPCVQTESFVSTCGFRWCEASFREANIARWSERIHQLHPRH